MELLNKYGLHGFGYWVKCLREQNKMTQEQLAHRIVCGPKWLVNFENNRIRINATRWHRTRLTMLADAFQMDIDDFKAVQRVGNEQRVVKIAECYHVAVTYDFKTVTYYSLDDQHTEPFDEVKHAELKDVIFKDTKEVF